MNPIADEESKWAVAAPVRVLIIDDDEQMRAFVLAVLVRSGYDVEDARNGAVGLQSFRLRPSDLVICDMFMPEFEGFETIREFQKLDPEVRIIAMSGGGSRSNYDPLPHAARMGASRTLTKPFTESELLATVGALSGRR